MQRRKNTFLLPIILVASVMALAIGGLVLADSLRKAQIQKPGEYQNQDDIPRLTVEEAYQAAVAGEAVLVDTRSESQYQAQRALTAINVPIDQINERVTLLKPDIWYLTYCT